MKSVTYANCRFMLKDIKLVKGLGVSFHSVLRSFAGFHELSFKGTGG